MTYGPYSGLVRTITARKFSKICPGDYTRAEQYSIRATLLQDTISCTPRCSTAPDRRSPASFRDASDLEALEDGEFVFHGSHNEELLSS